MTAVSDALEQVAGADAQAQAGTGEATGQPLQETGAAHDAPSQTEEAAKAAAKDKARAIEDAAFAKATAGGSPPLEPDEKTGEDKPAGEKPEEEKADEAEEAESLDAYHERLAIGAGYSKEEIAEAVKKFGADSFAEMAAHENARMARYLSRIDQEAKDRAAGTQDKGKVEEAQEEADKGQRKPPGKAAPVNLEGIAEITPEDLEAYDIPEPFVQKFNALAKAVKDVAMGGATSERLEKALSFVEQLQQQEQKRLDDEHEKDADSFFVGLAKEFPEYGDKPDKDYAPTDPRHLARKEIYEQAATLRAAHEMRTGREMAWAVALATAHNSANIETIKKGGQRLRQERRTNLRRSATPGGSIRKSEMTPQEAQEDRIYAAAEKKTGLIIPP